jgi:hypothetical protein
MLFLYQKRVLKAEDIAHGKDQAIHNYGAANASA